MGFLSGEDEAIMWRGLMLNRAVQHFLEDVRWGALDYLVIDLPPGTGDVQMGLARMLPRTEVLVVTTPNQAAQKVAGRAADMARRGHIRVAGVIENMSAFTCGHGETYEIFGSGGGQRLADEIGVPLVGSVPLNASVAAGGDAGVPIALDEAGPLAGVFAAIAERVVTEISPAGRDGRLQRPTAGASGKGSGADRRLTSRRVRRSGRDDQAEAAARGPAIALSIICLRSASFRPPQMPFASRILIA